MTLADISPGAINARIASRGYHILRFGYGHGINEAEYIDLLLQGPPHPDNKLDRSGLSSLRAYSMVELENLLEGLGTSV